MKIAKKTSQFSHKAITKQKLSDSQMQHDIAGLKAENLKLQRQIAKLRAEQVSLSNKIIILEENTNERCIHETPPYECIKKKHEMIQEEIKELESKKR